MSPDTRDGGPTTRPAVSTQIATSTQHPHPTGDHRQRRDLVAVGEYFPPAGRRRLGVVIVRRCPACAHLHLHRAVLVGTADGSTRTGSCGRSYVLRVLPAARAGSRAGSS